MSSLTRIALKNMAIRIAIVIGAGASVTYWHTTEVLKDRVLDQLNEYAKGRAQREEALFAKTETMQKHMASVIEQRLESAELADTFEDRYVRSADGAFRNRPERFDGQRDAAVHIGKSIVLNPALRRRIMIIQDACQQFGQAWRSEYQNTYIWTPEGMVALYWPDDPNWVAKAPAIIPPSQSPHLWQVTPGVSTRWSSTYQDGSSGELMVTCRTDIHLDGQFVGHVNNDIPLTELQARVVDDHLAGAHNMMVRDDRKLIVHPLLAHPGHAGMTFSLEEIENETMNAIFDLAVSLGSDETVAYYEPEDLYLASSEVGESGWYFITVYPGKLIAEPAISVARIVLLGGLASLVLEVLILWRSLRRKIREPLMEVVSAAEEVADGNLEAPIDTSRRDELGQLARSFSRMRDAIQARIAQLNVEIEQRRQAERSAEESEEGLATTLDSMGDGLIATDSLGLVTRINPVAASLTGWTGDSGVGHPLSEVCPLLKGSLPDSAHATPEEASHIQDLHLQARDGSRCRVSANSAPIHRPDGTSSGCVLVLRDVTAEFSLREQLSQSQKMEAIGQLAGGVAHDFNNLMTGVMGCAELLMGDELQEEQRVLVTEILSASIQARDLTRQLLDFGRQSQTTSNTTEAHGVLQAATQLLGRSIDKRIRIELNLEAVHSTVRGDEDQLKNAVLNLALNARDAIAEVLGTGGSTGVIQISTRNIQADAQHPAPFNQTATIGEYIEICVCDTGIGMSPEIQARMFEPFFTTKHTGRGPGLGLAGVYGFARSQDGGIQVESARGRGTTMRLFLPTAAQPEDLMQVTLVPQRAAQGSGHILLADDEEVILRMATRSLERQGYRVTSCCDGAQAVEIFQAHHAEIDLAILDVIMPRLSGEDAFKQMHEIDPAVPIVMTSGYSKDRSARELIALGSVGFLPKPYGARELSELVENCLKPLTKGSK